MGAVHAQYKCVWVCAYVYILWKIRRFLFYFSFTGFFIRFSPQATRSSFQVSRKYIHSWHETVRPLLPSNGTLCAMCFVRAGGVRGSARLIYSSSLEWRHTNLLRPNVVVATKDVCRAGKNGARGRKSEMDAVLVSSTQTKTRKVWWTILESVCLSLRGMCGRI